ncbi:hypothetical protein AWN76_012840 [Rhodothermaceae bacterium RA]|nr:hypothetical protein AWN76_012840 [Rhodothermaceae bacterium RA]
MAPLHRLLLMLGVAALAGSAAPMPAAAQTPVAPIRDASLLQVGVAALPGIGLQAGYLSPRSWYTREAVLYVDSSPQFAGGEGSVQIAAGIGAAVRILAITRLFSSTLYAGNDLDFGLRFGPGLFFAIDETPADKNQRFSLFLEPFIRYTSAFGGGRQFFAEAGVQRPFLRAGFWFRL